MTTAIFASSSSTGTLTSSWHGHAQAKQQQQCGASTNNVGSNISAVAASGVLTASELVRNSALSSDGYVRLLGVGNHQDLLNKSSSCSSISSNESQDGQQQTPVTKSSVSILAGKYLLLPEIPTMSQAGLAVKPEYNCVNIQTKEKYTCKVVPRNPKGLAMLAAYHRLEESTEFVNQVVEAILTPKMLYFIMPKNYGNVHSHLLANKSLKEPEAANIFKQMVLAVQYCHSKGVVLRDIKMGRFVFVDQARTIVKLESLEDAVLLTDSNNDSLDDKHGCPNYISPEKAEILRQKHMKYPGKATDIWSLGVMLYTMLVGRYPFNDSDNVKLFQKIRSGSFAIPQRLSASVTSLLKALLQKSPVGRPSCKEILRCSWIKGHCVPTSQLISSPTACSAWGTEGNSEVIPASKTLHQRMPDQVVPIL